MSGIVADIQRWSTGDGPGIRTTVFFKGCPLNCAWCHNPECISFVPQQLFYKEKCVGCGKCAEGCFSGARVLCGKRMTAEEVLEQICADRPYYGGEGGATFSGGEPLAQPEFLEELAEACLAGGIRPAVETSLCRFAEAPLRKMQIIMADLKLWNSEKHRKYIGAGNEQIKENLIRANELGVPMIVRTPVVPGVNDSAEEIAPIAEFAAGLSHVCRYELLPYHPIGNAKRLALGQAEAEFSVPPKNLMKELNAHAFLR